MKLNAIALPGREGTLAGLHYAPVSPGPTALLYAHGFTSGKYSLDGLAGYLATRGYPGVSFDFAGHKLGGSGGEMRVMQQAAESLADALAWTRENVEAERVALIGHSMGGVATLVVAAQERAGPHPAVPLAGIACLCVGTEPSRGFDSQIGKAMLAQREDYVAGAPALQLLTELDTLVLAAREIGEVPALFIAARQDVLVTPERVEALAALAGANATVQIIEAQHLDAPDKARGPIANWLQAQGL